MQLSSQTFQKNEETEEVEVDDKTVSMIESIIGPSQRFSLNQIQNVQKQKISNQLLTQIQKQPYQMINKSDHFNKNIQSQPQNFETQKYNNMYNQEITSYQQASKQFQDQNLLNQNFTNEIEGDQFQNQSVFSNSSQQHKHQAYQPNNSVYNQFQNVQYIPQQFQTQETGIYGQSSSFYQQQTEQPFQSSPSFPQNYTYSQQQRAILMNNEMHNKQFNNSNLSQEQIKSRDNQEQVQQKFIIYQNFQPLNQNFQQQLQYQNQGKSVAEYYQINQKQFGNPHYDQKFSQYDNSESPIETQERIQAFHNQTYLSDGFKQQFGSAEVAQRNNLSQINYKNYPGSFQVSQMSQSSPSQQQNYHQQQRNIYYQKKSDQEFEQNSFSSFTESKLIQNKNNISSSDMGTINQNQRVSSNFGKEQFSSDIEPNLSLIDDNYTDQSSDMKKVIQTVEIQMQNTGDYTNKPKKGYSSIQIQNLGQLAADQQFNGGKRPRVASGQDEFNNQQQLQVVGLVRGSGSAKAKYGENLNYEKQQNYQQNHFYSIKGADQPINYTQEVGKIIQNQDFRRKISSQTFIKNQTQRDQEYNEPANRPIDSQHKSQTVEENKIKKVKHVIGISSFPINSTKVNSENAHSSFGTEKETTSTTTLGYDEFIRQVEDKLKEADGDPEQEFRVLDGKIMRLAQRKRGSILLQNHLKTADQTLINKLVNQLLEGKLPELMMSKYGNYYSQQLIDYLQVHQRLQLLKTITGPKFVEISCNDPGTHVLQTILLHATQEEEFNIVRQTLVQSNNVIHMATDKKGHHVLKVILTQFPQEFKDIIFENLCQNFDVLAKDQNGLCVVKEVIKETKKDNDKQEQMINILLTGQKLLDYCQHEYGNFVVSEIIKNYQQNQWIRIIQKLKGYYVRFSQNQYASQLIEICIAKSPLETQESIIDEFVKSNQLHKVIQSKNGNYVIQKSLRDFIKDIGLQIKLLEAIVENLDNITDKKIRQKWGAELLIANIQTIFQRLQTQQAANESQKLANNQDEQFNYKLLTNQEQQDRLLYIEQCLHHKMFSTQKLQPKKKQQNQLSNYEQQSIPINRTIYNQSSQSSNNPNTFQEIYKSEQNFGKNKKDKVSNKYSDHNSTKDHDVFFVKDSKQLLSSSIQPNSMFAVSHRAYPQKLTQGTYYTNQAFSEMPEYKVQRQIHIGKGYQIKTQSVGIDSVGSGQKLFKPEEFSEEAPKNKTGGKKNRKITRIKQSNITFAKKLEQKQEEVLVCSSGGTTNRSIEQNAA